METPIGKLRTIQFPWMTVPEGSFSRTRNGEKGPLNPLGWTYCRDSFLNGQDKLGNVLLLYHEVSKTDNIAAFIYKVEKKLGHQKLSVVGPTSCNKITWIEPAAFWDHTFMRRSLFTILLRAGVKYNLKKDNFEKILSTAKYLKGTKTALNRFLEGNTWFKGDAGYGWYDRFYGRKKDDLGKMLTRKPITDKQLMDFALGLLNKTKEQLIIDYRQQVYGKKLIKTAETVK